MSHRSLHVAVRNQLRTAVLSGGCGYDQKTCEVMPDGQPPANCGAVFVAVHRGRRQNVSKTCLEDEVSVMVTVSVRSGIAPRDRQGVSLTDKVTSGLEDLVDAIRACLAKQRYAVMNAANTIINLNVSHGSEADAFVEPLVPGSDMTRPVNAAWFGAEGDDVAGWVCELEMTGAKRIQAFEGAT